MLRMVGVEVPDTRAWRLERIRDVHPLVDALLTWRKADRVATTYGYSWLDANVGTDGRLHVFVELDGPHLLEQVDHGIAVKVGQR